MIISRVDLGSLCHLITKGTTPTSVGLKFSSSGIPFLRIQNLKSCSVELKNVLYINKDTHQVLKRSIIQPKDFLLTIAGTIGKAAIVPDNFSECNCNQAVAILRFNNEKLDSYYLLYWLQTTDALRQIAGKKVTATISNLSLGKIKSLQIPLPPLIKQKEIAAILDTADQLKQKDQQLIDHYTRLSQSLFLEMFGDPVSNQYNFEKGTIRDFLSSAKYGTSSKAQLDGEYAYLRMNNITYKGEMDFNSLKYISLSEKDKPKFLVKKGDILFNRTNSRELVGKTGIFNEDKAMAIAGYLIRLRTNEYANPYFIWGYLNSQHGKLVLKHMCKSIVGMANINAQELQDIKILLPPLNLQNQFAQHIEKIEQQKQYAQASLKKSETLFNSLLQRAFKGELTQSHTL